MELTPKITPFQFYTILFLSRVFAMVTYVASFMTQRSSTDEVIMSLIMGGFLLLTAIPTAIFIKKDNTSSIITRASCVSTVFSKILCVIFFIQSLYFGIITSVRFGIFTGSVMFPDINIIFFIFVMLAASSYIAYKGIEAMGRSAVIILIPVFIALIFVFATQSKQFDLLNFTSLFSVDIKNTFLSGLYSCTRTGELAFVTLLTPYVNNQKSRHLFRWIFAIVLTIFVSEILISGVLGNFAGTQLFSMYAMSVLAEFGFIERLDAIITCLWLLCAAVKIAITIFLCETLLSAFFGKRKQILFIVISASVIFLGTIPLSGSLITLANIIRSPLTIIFYLASVFLVPIAVMIGEKIKGRAKLEKN
ncbi:MAG: GerAB/ArcD/ProY family transporter [Clostridia bacterium]|nr:GerAB/ArcD/ProY family transporter [Clostridia bacterium]